MKALTEKAQTALKAALVQRGKHKGAALKAKCPAADTLAAAAWMGAVATYNPYKMSVGQIMFFSAEQKEIFDEVERWTEAHPELRGIDRDRRALETMGVW